MNINSLNSYQGQASNYSRKPSNQTSEFLEVLKSKSKEPIQQQGEERVLGRWAMVRTGIDSVKIVSIKYADDSTPKDPIMCTTDGDIVHINDVDPSNATELEMQMFCAHLDATGRGTGSTFGTYNDLRTVRMTAHINQLTTDGGLIVNDTDLRTIRRDWTRLTKEVMEIVKSNDTKLYNTLDKMLTAITEYHNK